MSPDPDEEALRWAGDEEPVVAARPEPAPAEPAEEGAVGEPSPRTASLLLVVYGMLAGVYAIYTVGWALAVPSDAVTLPTLFAEVMYQFGQFLAIAAPGVWLATALLLTRGGRPLARLAWLVAGLVVLVPWPFVLRGLA